LLGWGKGDTGGTSATPSSSVPSTPSTPAVTPSTPSASTSSSDTSHQTTVLPGATQGNPVVKIVPAIASGAKNVVTKPKQEISSAQTLANSGVLFDAAYLIVKNAIPVKSWIINAGVDVVDRFTNGKIEKFRKTQFAYSMLYPREYGLLILELPLGVIKYAGEAFWQGFYMEWTHE
jgi:hypothetical protein